MSEDKWVLTEAVGITDIPEEVGSHEEAWLASEDWLHGSGL